jgi:hypothetical protein
MIPFAVFAEHYKRARYHESLGNLIRLTFTSGKPRPSSPNAKGSNARPSQIVVCSITCMPLNLNHR